MAILVPLILLFWRAGLWQLDRAEAARTAGTTASARAGLPPLPVGESGAHEALRYRQAVARGVYEFEDRLLLDGRKQAGIGGFHLLVPLRLEDSDLRVLVNLGWVPDPASVTVPVGGEVQGVLDRPRVPALQLGVSRGEVRPYVDLADLSRQRGYPVYPYVLVADQRLAEAALAAGVQRGEKRGMHLGYAIQWFFFALLAVALLVLLVRPGTEK